MNRTELSYRKTAAEGASGFSLLIALYDTLAGDLRRAADAERQNDLEARNLEANHAMRVIGYLEDWASRGSGGELANKLVTFYSTLRRKLIEAQASRSHEILEQQMGLVLKVREQWHEIEVRASSALDSPPAEWAPGYIEAPSFEERRILSWSA